jgi:putative ABC transport system substrate-binding protein
MIRRAFIAALLGAVLPIAAPLRAQAERVHRIGIIGLVRRPSEDVLRAAMRDLGYVEGRNVVYEARHAAGDAGRLPELARELLRLKVDVIITAGAPAALAAREATSTVPIVLWGAGDPVGTGLVRDVSRPGGNLTGIAELSTELTSKRLEVFKEAVPSLRRLAVIWNAGDRSMTLRFNEVESTAPRLQLAVTPLPIRKLDDFDGVFDAMAGDPPDGLFVVTDALTRIKEGALFEFARRQKLPTMFEFATSVTDGGLLSYGPSIAEMAPRAAAFVDKILKGARPGDLPLETPVGWHLAVNLKTARAIGLTIPPNLLARADEVIE